MKRMAIIVEEARSIIVLRDGAALHHWIAPTENSARRHAQQLCEKYDIDGYDTIRD